MIDLYTSTTPNGRKASIALEELGVPYRVHHLDLGKEDQKQPEYLAINPNGRIPAIVDDAGPDGRVQVFESGAILIYLAEKYGEGRFLPGRGQARYEALAWLMFQMGGVGPMFGQAGFFLRATDKNQQALDRYLNESRRLLGVLDARLVDRAFLAGDYSIADMATYPWVAAAFTFLGLNEDGWRNVRRWTQEVGARPAVQRGMNVPQTKQA